MSFSIFFKNNCPFCIKTENLFNANNLKYNKFVLDKDFNRDEFNYTFGDNSTFPRVFHDKELIGGSDDTEIYLKKYLK